MAMHEKPAQGQIWFENDFRSHVLQLTSFRVALLEAFPETTERNPIIIAGSLERPDFNGDYTSIELITIEEPDHSSGVALRIEVSFTDVDGARQKSHMHWFATAIGWRIKRSEIANALKATFRSSRISTIAAVEQLASLDLSSPDPLIDIAIEKPPLPASANLFTYHDNFGTQSDIVRHIRTELNSKRSVKLMSNRYGVKTQLDNIRMQMAEQIEVGFETRWFDARDAIYESRIGKAPFGISTSGLRRSGRGIPPPSRYTWLTKTCYSSVREFYFATFLGLEQEHMLDQDKPSTATDVPIQFFSIQGNSEYLNFVLGLYNKKQSGKGSSTVAIKKGDVFHIKVDDSGPYRGFQCQAQQKELDDDRAIVAGLLQRHEMIAAGKFCGPVADALIKSDVEFQAIKANLRGLFKKENCMMANVEIKVSNTTYSLRVKALEEFQHTVTQNTQRGIYLRAVSCGCPYALPKVDMLGDFDGTERETELYISKVFESSTDEQKDALKLFRATHGGIGVIDGCAGSGKSHFTRCLMIAHLFRKSASREYKKIIVPVAMNDTGNAIVNRLRADAEVAREILDLDRRPIVLRAHKITAEQEITTRDAVEEASERRRETVSSDVRVDNCLVDAVEQHTGKKPKRRYRISGKKVVEREKSVGWMMARFLGLLGDDDEYKKQTAFHSNLKHTLISYHCKDDLGESKRADLMQDLHQLLKEVLAFTDVLVFTTTQALDPNYWNNYPAKLMVIDEASQINDAELAGLLACYSSVQRTVLAGDCKQLGVYTEQRYRDDGERNPVLSQWSKSVHQRLRDCGHVSASFLQQRRCTYDIADLISNVYYYEDVKGEPCTRNRELSRRVREFNARSFNKFVNVIFIDVVNTKPSKLNTSTRCLETASVVLELIEDLGKYFEPETIFALSPYTAQKEDIESRLRKLGEKDDRFKGPDEDTPRVEAYSLKGVQGRENVISILDLTVGEDIGFLREAGQTLVGCSRGSDGLYIIGDVSAIKRTRRWEHTAVGQLVSYCLSKGYDYKWKKSGSG